MFRRRRRESSADIPSGVPDRVAFRLPLPSTPEHMPAHAQRIVEAAQRIDGVELDYSVESLADVDRLLGQFHESGEDPARIAETIFCFGAYIGEVINRATGSTWIEPADDDPITAGSWPMVQHPLRVINPIGKAFKRVSLGPGEDIPYFFYALTT